MSKLKLRPWDVMELWMRRLRTAIRRLLLLLSMTSRVLKMNALQGGWNCERLGNDRLANRDSN
ncbi:MAG: hypothetical protein RKR03_17185 [Candidatus Competibacter sp.]|nr:hypothetical protein [Candidatus Competibacter sp.]